MVKTRTVKLNGVDYIQSYSDEGKFIKRGEQAYFEAIDPVGFVRDYEETDIPTETQTPYEVNRQISQEVSELGGIMHSTEPSDKLGFDWEIVKVGDVEVRKTYVSNTSAIGTKENPYTDDSVLVDNAYYIINGIKYVAMSGQLIEFDWE